MGSPADSEQAGGCVAPLLGIALLPVVLIAAIWANYQWGGPPNTPVPGAGALVILERSLGGRAYMPFATANVEAAEYNNTDTTWCAFRLSPEDVKAVRQVIADGRAVEGSVVRAGDVPSSPSPPPWFKPRSGSQVEYVQVRVKAVESLAGGCSFTFIFDGSDGRLLLRQWVP